MNDNIDVGPGWRRLGPDETIKEGDEFLSSAGLWFECTDSAGRTPASVFGGNRPIRRAQVQTEVRSVPQPPDPGEGWELCELGHAEEWYEKSTRIWKRMSQAGRHYLPYYYRCRVAVTDPPSEGFGLPGERVWYFIGRDCQWCSWVVHEVRRAWSEYGITAWAPLIPGELSPPEGLTEWGEKKQMQAGEEKAAEEKPESEASPAGNAKLPTWDPPQPSADPGAGWRLLESWETIAEGDEWSISGTGWTKCVSSIGTTPDTFDGWTSRPQSGIFIRRKVVADTKAGHYTIDRAAMSHLLQHVKQIDFGLDVVHFDIDGDQFSESISVKLETTAEIHSHVSSFISGWDAGCRMSQRGS